MKTSKRIHKKRMLRIKQSAMVREIFRRHDLARTKELRAIALAAAGGVR